ncbi:MAG TPA: dihydrodipicolinate synthase family protein [Advenella sp.]|nr:dihydrodipicolinate synthase family protein [Advenella sp.]
MKTSPVSIQDLQRSVIAVPPLARDSEYRLNKSANRALLTHLYEGGVRTVMYGGNANFYHLGVNDYADTVAQLAELAQHDMWVLPSVGPDFGKMRDQTAILRGFDFPTAMLLPMTFPYTEQGLADGIRYFSDAFGDKIVVYIKSDRYLPAETMASLVEEGRIVSFKYAVVRSDPTDDPYLQSILACVSPELIVSGIGETPAIDHMGHFGLKTFTSGSVCLAPAGSMGLLRAMQANDTATAHALRAHYMAFEALRDAINPIRVLHDGVTLAGIADMGSILPMFSGLTENEARQVGPIARQLAAWGRSQLTENKQESCA